MPSPQAQLAGIYHDNTATLKALVNAGATRPRTAIQHKLARKTRLVIYGQSSTTRQFYDAAILNAQVVSNVLIINFLAPHNLMTGARCYCTMPPMQQTGRITVTSATQVTMPFKDANNLPLTVGTGAPDTLLWLGSYTGASAVGRWAATLGASLEVFCVSRHSDDVEGNYARFPQVRDLDPDAVFWETAAANAMNNGRQWDIWFPVILANFYDLLALGIPLIIPTLQTPDQTQGGPVPDAGKLRDFNRYTQWVLSLPRYFPNVYVFDNTGSSIDRSSSTGNALPGNHHDYLHANPRGAYMAYTDGLATMQKLFPTYSRNGRMGAADVYANGGLQLFDGLFSATGQQTLPGPAPAPTGTLDNTFTVTSAGGGGSRSCACSIVDRGGSFLNMKKQRFVVSPNNSNSTVWTADCIGNAGGLFKDRLIAGHTYEVTVKSNVSAIAVGMRLSIIVALTMTGVPGMTGEVLAWAGRNQRGTIELQASGAIQTDAEGFEYCGDTFTLPAFTTMTAASVRWVMESGGANSGWTVEAEDIAWRDITDNVLL